MLYLRNTNLKSMVKACYVAIDSAPLSSDPDIYKEDTAILIFEVGYTDPDLVIANGKKLSCVFDQELYFPNHCSLKREAEDIYWNEKLVDEGALDKIVNHLKDYPSSRSCLINFWDNRDFVSANPKGSCLIQVYCRVRENRLDMHAHMRANDVHRCLFMDLAYLLYAHTVIADQTNIPKGEFVHIVDSLHIYKKTVDEFHGQLEYIQNAKSTW